MFVFSSAYPLPSFEHIHSNINNNTTIEKQNKKEKKFHLKQSALRTNKKN
jgi:hypothetical protein